MLTKSLLKHTVRQGKVFPKYINPKDEAIIGLADAMTSVFSEGVGQTIQQLEKALQPYSDHKLFEGFKKLLEDSCEFSDEGFEDVENRRWDLFIRSKELRRSLTEGTPSEVFLKKLAGSDDLGQLQEQLYGDLPINRKIKKFAPLEGSLLIHRYNASQIQGLLLLAKTVSISLEGLTLVEKRRLVQKIRFHGLLLGSDLDPKDQSPSFQFSLSGPLGIFEGSSIYGAKLANFFPHILHFPNWSLSASLKLNQKPVTLECSSKKKILTHYRSLTGYIPEEFNSLIETFNKKSRSLGKAWVMSVGGDYIHLGEKNYCFPDFQFKKKGQAPRYLELFHKWHSSSLRQRLALLRDKPNDSLIIGVSRDLVKKGQVQNLIDMQQENGVKVIKYTSFPTAKALLAYLS